MQLWDQVADPAGTAGIERAVLLERLAEVASGDGDNDLAIRYVDEAIDEAANAGPARRGDLYSQRTKYLWMAGRVTELTEWTERAVTLLPADPPTPEAALVLAEHAFVLACEERHDEAGRIAMTALEAASKAGAARAEARARNALGVCFLMTSADAADGRRQLERALVIARQIGQPEEVVSTYANLVDSLVRLGRYDDAAELAREAAEAAADLAILQSGLGLLLLNGAEALLLAGRWKECDQALQQLGDRRAGGLVEYLRLGLTAILEAFRGNDDLAETAVAEADGSGVHDIETKGVLCAARAQLALNAGDPDAAHRYIVESLDALEHAETELGTVPAAFLAVIGLRVEADRAQLGRIRHDATEETDAIDSVRSLGARTLSLRVRACAAAQRTAVTRLHEALCDAEHRRAKGQSDPESWRAVAACDDPHRTAYAGFREAEAVLSRRGSRTRGHRGAGSSQRDRPRTRGSTAPPRDRGTCSACPHRIDGSAIAIGWAAEASIVRSGTARAHDTRDRGPSSDRRRVVEPGDRQDPVHQLQDGESSRVEHPQQTRRD